MGAPDVTETLDEALAITGVDQVRVKHRPRLHIVNINEFKDRISLSDLWLAYGPRVPGDHVGNVMLRWSCEVGRPGLRWQCLRRHPLYCNLLRYALHLDQWSNRSVTADCEGSTKMAALGD